MPAGSAGQGHPHQPHPTAQDHTQRAAGLQEQRCILALMHARSVDVDVDAAVDVCRGLQLYERIRSIHGQRMQA